jgi:hypothetical protein
MAIDLEAIRRKVNQLNGIKNQGNVKVWKPKIGQHRIRVLPWKDAKEGLPFKERLVYFGIGKGPLVSPESFGKHDPIREFTKKLWDGGKEEDKALAKKLFAKLQTCAAIVDRSVEDEGPQLWVMNKLVAKDVTNLFLNAELGDFTDIGPEGTDLIVDIVLSPKKFNGRDVHDVSITASRKSSPASTDPAKVTKWMDSLPNVDEFYRPLSSEEVKARFEGWMNEGGVAAMMSGGQVATPETTRGPADTSVVDDIANDIAASTEKSAKSPAKDDKAPTKVKAKKDNKEFANVEDALDDALGDLSDLE